MRRVSKPVHARRYKLQFQKQNHTCPKSNKRDGHRYRLYTRLLWIVVLGMYARVLCADKYATDFTVSGVMARPVNFPSHAMCMALIVCLVAIEVASTRAISPEATLLMCISVVGACAFRADRNPKWHIVFAAVFFYTLGAPNVKCCVRHECVSTFAVAVVAYTLAFVADESGMLAAFAQSKSLTSIVGMAELGFIANRQQLFARSFHFRY